MAGNNNGTSSSGAPISANWSQNLVDPSRYSKKCPNAMTPVGICMHNTANNAPASNEISYMRSNDQWTSFHFAIDENQAVQGLPLDRNGWHAGDGNGPGNRQHIGIEIARSTDYTPGVFEQAERRSAAVVAKLCQQYGFGLDQIKAHRDFMAKDCPHRTNMNAFKNMVKLAMDGKLTDNTDVTDQGNTSGGGNSGSITVGSRVKVTGSTYATGQNIPGWVKNNTYTVTEMNGNRALLSGINSWVYVNDLATEGGSAAPKTEEKKQEEKKQTVSATPVVGSKVKITGSTYATGQNIPDWVKKNTYTISQINGDRALIKEIYSWVRLSDLAVEGATNSVPDTKPADQSVSAYEKLLADNNVVTNQDLINVFWRMGNSDFNQAAMHAKQYGVDLNALCRDRQGLVKRTKQETPAEEKKQEEAGKPVEETKPDQPLKDQTEAEKSEYEAALDKLSHYPGGKLSPGEFIEMFGPIAREDNRETGVPASVTLAQAALETGWGGSSIGDAKNLFGIKGVGPAGTTQSLTKEWENGQYITIRDGFRRYNTWLESVKDHSKFLLENSRYANAFNYCDNPDQFAREIHKAGYATAPDYSDILINIMQTRDLYRFNVSKKSDDAKPAEPVEETKPVEVAVDLLSSAQAQKAIEWNKNKNYSLDCIKAIQKVVGTDVDGSIGPKTVQAIARFQKSKGIDVDGMFGNGSAAAAGITLEYNTTSTLANKAGTTQFVNYNLSQYNTDAVSATNDGANEAAKYDKYMGMVNLMVDATKNVQGAEQAYSNQLVGKYTKLEESVGVVNVVGIRGFTQEDGVVANTFNLYNDTIVALWLENAGNGQVIKRCKEFHASVDPGKKYGGEKFQNEGGVIAHMPEGQLNYSGGRYDYNSNTYRINPADGSGRTMSYYDFDHDGQIGDYDRARGLQQSEWIQVHRGWTYANGGVNGSSVGCQIIQDGEYDGFFNILKNVFGNASNWHFRYTLLNGNAVAEEHNRREEAKKAKPEEPHVDPVVEDPVVEEPVVEPEKPVVVEPEKPVVPVNENLLSKSEEQSAINWNKGKNYTYACIKEIQKIVGTDVDGDIGPKTVQAIARFQKEKGLDVDGKFGNASATAAGITLAYDTGSGNHVTPTGVYYGGAKKLREMMVPGDRPFANIPPFCGYSGYDVSNLRIDLKVQPEDLEQKDDPNQIPIKSNRCKAPAGEGYSGGESTVGYRHNNPCNISHSSYDIGYVMSERVVDGQNHAAYDSMLNGTASAMRLLREKYGNRSIRGINDGYQGYYNENEDVSLTALRLVWITNFVNRMGDNFDPTARMDTSDKETMMGLVYNIAIQETSMRLQYDFLSKAYDIAFPS